MYQLIGQGVLAQENLVLSNGHTAGILKLNGASVEVMKGNRTVKLVQIVRKSAREARKTRGEAISWEGVDVELFETLRKWRKAEADRRVVPPYVVFSDATLRELAKHRPETPAAFREVYGIGESKLAEYGRAVLEIICRHGKGGGMPRASQTAGLEEVGGE